MKKIVFVLMVLSMLVFVRMAAAENLDFSERKWELSGQLGGAIPKDNGSDSSFFFLGRLTYDLTPHIAVGATTGWNSYEVNVDNDNWGDATNIPLLVNVVLKMPIESTENHVVPYLIGGVGVSFWSLDESSLLKDNGVSVDSQTSFAAQVGAGVDYFFNDRVAVFGEMTYFLNDVSTSISAPGLSGTLEGDTDALFIGVGAKARF